MAKFPFHLSRWWTWILGSIAAVILIVIVLSYLISSEFLRRTMEQQMNRHLKGYRVQVGRAYFHPIAFSVDLEDLTLKQEVKPGPPVANINRLHASVHWREYLRTHRESQDQYLADHHKPNPECVHQVDPSGF